MINDKTITNILARSRMRCEACGKKKGQEIHHIFFKSDYPGKDQNYLWNLAFLCRKCHSEIHNETNQGKIYNYELKLKALKRRGKTTTEMLSSVKRLGKDVEEIKKAKNIIKNFKKKTLTK